MAITTPPRQLAMRRPEPLARIVCARRRQRMTRAKPIRVVAERMRHPVAANREPQAATPAQPVAPRVERRAPAPRAAQRVERPVVTLAVPRVAARRVERPVVTLAVPRVAAQRVERPVVTLAGPQAATAADRNK